MMSSRSRWFGGVLALALGSSPAAQAGGLPPHYHYISLDDAVVPPGFSGFGPVTFPAYTGGLNNRDQIAGAVFDDSGQIHVGVYDQGVVTVLQPVLPSWGTVINQGGTVGGSALNPETGNYQAALFHDGRVELIPPQPGEVFAFVFALNDGNTAVAASFGASSTLSVLYHAGHATPLVLGGGVTLNWDVYVSVYLDNRGDVAGTTGDDFTDAFGLRFNPNTRNETALLPAYGDPTSWAQGINQFGSVLGYSFVTNGQERIGVWDGQGNFNVYWTEGNAQYPTISNHLIFNDQDQIVITWNSDGTSYLLPEPGVRLDLAELTDNLPSWSTPLGYATSINDRGDIIGSAGLGGEHPFLLQCDTSGGGG